MSVMIQARLRDPYFEVTEPKKMVIIALKGVGPMLIALIAVLSGVLWSRESHRMEWNDGTQMTAVTHRDTEANKMKLISKHH